MYDLLEVPEEDRKVRDRITEGRDSERAKPRPGIPAFEKGRRCCGRRHVGNL